MKQNIKILSFEEHKTEPSLNKNCLGCLCVELVDLRNDWKIFVVKYYIIDNDVTIKNYFSFYNDKLVRNIPTTDDVFDIVEQYYNKSILREKKLSRILKDELR